ncbi:hypothetical protein BKA58DRAFT_383030 [Alternaria rosae]|uniref:uncharacterized protein n=1 Tax=Alternaria rosae TaxID=1187941 RepID=UPI001E8E4903|nr:uncharacterized protein BKA58DRAFT_383030 [Alternaria rosae]KAH6872918.1 hypothetical protein BKA58DRAFT_383030 [Alternaria rosae]
MSEPLLGAYQTSHRDHGLIAERVEGRRSASSAHITQTSSANGRAVETSPAPFSPDTNNDATRPSHQSERRHSTTSSPNMPFSISVGPPRKSALTTPFAATMPMSCSITRNAPFSTAWPISRTGIGGTMASTPMTSPVLDIASTCLTPARTYSLAATRQQDQATSSPRTPSHSRNVSGSSVRTVIRT